MKLNPSQAIEQSRKLELLGRTQDASALLEAVLKLDPANPLALQRLKGIKHPKKISDVERAELMQTFQSGNIPKAIQLSQQLANLYPSVAFIQTIQGAAFAQTGDHVNAQKAFAKAVALDPNSAQALTNLGGSLKELGRASQAREVFLKAIQLDPKFAQAYNNLAILLKGQKRFPQAVRRFKQAIDADPNYLDAQRNLGVAYQEMGQHSDAIEVFSNISTSHPNDLETLSFMANSLRAEEKFAQSIEILKQILSKKPNRVAQRLQLGLALVEVAQYAEAIEQIEMVVKTDPNNIVNLIHFGNALSRTDDLDKAQSVLERVLEIDPNNLGALNNLGVLFQNRGDLVGAGAVYDQALAIEGDLSELRMNRSVVHFLSCEFEQGWEKYNARFEHANPSTPFLKTSKPVWTGKKERVFVWAEQGVGDEIFFASLLNDAKAKAADLIVSVDPRLKAMFNRSFEGIQFVSRHKTLNEDLYDSHIPLGGLGGLLRSDLQSFDKQPCAFLAVDPTRAQDIKQQLGAFEGLTIGISWRTQNRKSNHVRNIELAQFLAPFQGQNVRFVNLQYGDTDADVASVVAKTGADIVTLLDLDRFKDIEGLAAAIDACDHVVTIDNSTVHLAAALGKDTHVMLPFFPDWRWADVPNGSLWYPDLNIYRQGSRFGWDGVLQDIAQQLHPKAP